MLQISLTETIIINKDNGINLQLPVENYIKSNKDWKCGSSYSSEKWIILWDNDCEDKDSYQQDKSKITNDKYQVDYNQVVDSLFGNSEDIKESKLIKRRFGKIQDRGKFDLNYILQSL